MCIHYNVKNVINDISKRTKPFLILQGVINSFELVFENFSHAVQKQFDDTFLCKIFKAAHLLGLGEFFRLSNLVPHSFATFSHYKHLAKGDIFFTQTEGIVLLKWTKT